MLLKPVVWLRRPHVWPAMQPIGVKDRDGVNVLALVTQKSCKKYADSTQGNIQVTFRSYSLVVGRLLCARSVGDAALLAGPRGVEILPDSS